MSVTHHEDTAHKLIFSYVCAAASTLRFPRLSQLISALDDRSEFHCALPHHTLVFHSYTPHHDLDGCGPHACQ